MKKRFMRIMSMLMVLVMTLGMCVTGWAADFSITVENSVGGVTYSLYKVFDVTYPHDDNGTPTGDAVSYTFDATNTALAGLVNGSDSPFTATLSADGSVYVVTSKTDSAGNALEVGAWFNENLNNITAACGDIVDTKQGNGSSITFTPSTAGYYLIVPSVDNVPCAAVSVDTTHPDAKVVDKNQTPGGGNSFKKDADADSYSVGDTAEYTITSYVPTYDADKQVISYTFTDTMGAGLTLDAVLSGPDTEGIYNVTSGVTVEIEGTGFTKEEVTSYCTITVSYDEEKNTILTISYEINDITDYPADANITISYKATVNEAADDNNVTNKVTMAYKEEGSDTPIIPDPTPETHSYIYGFDLAKTDGSSNALTGAEFTLQKQLTEGGVEPAYGDPLTLVYDAESDTFEVWDGIDSGTTTNTIIISAANGKVNVWGLAAGTYLLTETKSPDGYNLLENPVTIVIAETETGWSVSVDGGDPVSGVISDSESHGVSSMPTVTIVNNAGTVLPGTGGIGTTIFYLVGGILILAATAFAITRWRLGRSE